MEFHDVLHGLIRIDDERLLPLVADLLGSTEVQRLRNMRQMNFDVPLIQELGRSRRLPHSIGVLSIAIRLAHRSKLHLQDTKAFLTAALLHDATIPPYGHLVESEFKKIDKDFSHETILKQLILGTMSKKNLFEELLPGEYIEVHRILNEHDVDREAVIRLACPPAGSASPISADIDIDNIDNVHRMACMLGWDNARENARALLDSAALDKESSLRSSLRFSAEAVNPIKQWLEFRQNIYTLIIAHPQCIPHNALQADLARIAVKYEIIKPEDWRITEPEFEEKLRSSDETKALADQLIAGCKYRLIDYVWFKGLSNEARLVNAEVDDYLQSSVELPVRDAGYFVWHEKGLISRKIQCRSKEGKLMSFGEDSNSCMVALVRKGAAGVGKLRKTQIKQWRRDVVKSMADFLGNNEFSLHYPEDYTGSYYGDKTNEFRFTY